MRAFRSRRSRCGEARGGVPSTEVRPKILVTAVGCLFAALFARLWDLQVITASNAQAVASDNGIRTVYTPAPRGLILDRNGIVLVGNLNEPAIEVDRQVASAHPGMENRLAPLLGMSLPQLKAAIANPQYSPFQPVPVMTNASAQGILYVQEHPRSFPGVRATTVTVRSYTPAGKAATNLLGYVGRITASEYRALKSHGYRPDSHYSASG